MENDLNNPTIRTCQKVTMYNLDVIKNFTYISCIAFSVEINFVSSLLTIKTLLTFDHNEVKKCNKSWPSQIIKIGLYFPAVKIIIIN